MDYKDITVISYLMLESQIWPLGSLSIGPYVLLTCCYPLSTFLLSCTTKYSRLILLLSRLCNQSFLQEFLISFSGECYLETKICAPDLLFGSCDEVILEYRARKYTSSGSYQPIFTLACVHTLEYTHICLSSSLSQREQCIHIDIFHCSPVSLGFIQICISILWTPPAVRNLTPISLNTFTHIFNPKTHRK